MNYLGYLVTSRTLHVATKTRDAVQTLEYSTTKILLRSFHVLSNVFRRFVPNFAKNDAPLNGVLVKSARTKVD